MARILAFGIAREIVGGTTTDIALPEGASVDVLRSVLSEKYPRLKQLIRFMIAVNGEYAQPGQIIRQNDEIAIIPPVSGG